MSILNVTSHHAPDRVHDDRSSIRALTLALLPVHASDDTPPSESSAETEISVAEISTAVFAQDDGSGASQALAADTPFDCDPSLDDEGSADWQNSSD